MPRRGKKVKSGSKIFPLPHIFRKVLNIIHTSVEKFGKLKVTMGF